MLPTAILFPMLWAFSPSRLVAGMVSAGYFLAASRGLPQGVVNYFGDGLAAGIGLWLAASSSFVAVHAALWTPRAGWRRMLHYAVAALLMSIPPFGIVGWAHPVTAAGILFPGWHWWGLAAATAGLLAMLTRVWSVTVAVLGVLWLWSAVTWTVPKPPDGWVGIETRFRGAEGQYADYAQQLGTISIVRAAAAQGAMFIVLPESALGFWTPTVEQLWTQALDGLDVTVIAGAIVVDEQGYDNVMVGISGMGGRVLYRERMPVPGSMWQPWLAVSGEDGGAAAHLLGNPVVEMKGLRIAPLICYEQLLVWPVLQSALYSPDAVVAIGNGWWTEGTRIIAVQEAAAIAWAKLFDLPLVIAFNS